MGTTIQTSAIQGLTRPYFGPAAQDVPGIKPNGKPGNDVTTPPAPQVLRAWAFELAADGSQLAPPPPPAGQPGRDPLVIELGNIEVGTRVEVISLSDNPAAEFDAGCKGEIFELPLTGYDVANRRATIALNDDQMKEKGIVAGERLLLRQVDKDGNASAAVHVHLDPGGWANQRINEPVQGGGSQQVNGRQIDVTTGLVNLPGDPNPGRLERVLGKSTRDTSAPTLLASNVTVTATAMTPKEHQLIKDYVKAMSTLIGSSPVDLSYIARTLANNAAWEQNAAHKPHVDVLKALVADPAQFARLSTFAGLARHTTSAPQTIDWAGANDLAGRAQPPSFASVKLDRALEPGTQVRLQNSRTGEVVTASQAAGDRGVTLPLQDGKNGDPLILTYSDAAGNAGAPYAFRLDDSCAGGKAKSNPLDVRLASFSLRPRPAAAPAA